MLYIAVLITDKGIKLLQLGEKTSLHHTWNHIYLLLHLRRVNRLVKMQTKL